jgi:hypothetical protein
MLKLVYLFINKVFCINCKFLKINKSSGIKIIIFPVLIKSIDFFKIFSYYFN